MIGPMFDAHLIREKSSAEKVMMCSTDLLYNITDGEERCSRVSKALSQRVLDDNYSVSTFAEARSIMLSDIWEFQINLARNRY
jgi:hypothetical protein